MNKNSDGVDQNVGVFVLAELPSRLKRLSLGQEAGCRPMLPWHSRVALVGQSQRTHFGFVTHDMTVESASLLVRVTVELNEIMAVKTANSCDARLPVPLSLPGSLLT